MTEPLSKPPSRAGATRNIKDHPFSSSGSGVTASPVLADLISAEKHFRGLSHIDDICLIPVDGDAAGLFAVVVPNADELTQRHVASARGRVGELLEISGCVLPRPLRVSDFALTSQPLPRDTAGGLLRGEIAQRFAAAGDGNGDLVETATAAPHLLPSAGLRQRFRARLGEILTIDRPLSPHDHLETDLGMDSLAQMEIRVVLEDEFAVTIPDDELWRVQTLGDILERLPENPASADGKLDGPFWRHELRRSSETVNSYFEKPATPFSRGFFRLLQTVFWVALRFLFRAQVSGLEKIPSQGPVLLCPNHLSYLDSPIIHCLLPRRLIARTHFLGYREIFRDPPLAWMIRGCRLILTGDAESVLDSLRLCFQALKHGKAVCVFPEGIRSTTGTLMRARPGIGMLACEAQAPVIPILIEGSEATMSPPNPGFHLGRVRVVVGEPIIPPAGNHFTVADYQAVADRWRQAVLRLRGENASRSRV